jgi:hypothetical protein
VQTLHRLGLLDILVQDQVPASHAVAMQAGRLIGIETAPHYGVAYEDMVNRARQHLPPFVRFIKAKVRDLHLSADRQQLRLCDGGLIQGRLVVLATGLGRRLLHEMQMRPKVIRAEQSLTFGFDVEVARPAMFASSVLVAYGERRADCIDYLTCFLSRTGWVPTCSPTTTAMTPGCGGVSSSPVRCSAR